MPNLATVIKTEILRLTQKGIKQAFGALKAEQIKLRKEVAALKRELAAQAKAGKLARKAAVVAAKAPEAGEEQVGGARIRPTGKVVRQLREKFKMSQDELGRLCEVGRVTVARWESSDERIQFRGAKTKAIFAAVMKLGKKEAWARIGGAQSAENQAEEGKKRRGRKPAAAKVVAEGAVAPKRRGRKPKQAAPAVVVLKATEAPVSAGVPTTKKTGKVVRKARKK